MMCCAVYKKTASHSEIKCEAALSIHIITRKFYIFIVTQKDGLCKTFLGY